MGCSRHRGICLVILLATGFAVKTALLRGSNEGGISIWHSYSATASPTAADHPASDRRDAAPRTYQPTGRRLPIATDDPSYHAENRFGFPVRQDPLFDENAKPSWQPFIINRPDYDRPSYDEPNDAGPYLRQDPVRKPVYEKPLYTMPNDDKPRYDFKYIEAPAYVAPTFNDPVYRAPNYVIKPDIAPAYDRPGYDMREIYANRPEYQAPVYEPQEYQKPRELPAPYIKPAE